MGDPDLDGGEPDETPPLWPNIESVYARLQESDGLLLCTDFDGTLARIVDDPSTASITPANRTTLRDLRDHGKAYVAVISGRALADVRERVDVPDITYAGNHGLELRRGGQSAVHPLAAARRAVIERACVDVEERLDDLSGLLVERKGVTATVHYRHAPADEVTRIRDVVREVAHRHAGDVEVVDGKASLELRPAVPWHKGSAARLLADRRPGNWLPVVVGDDTTDEHAFREFAGEGVTVRVGPGATAADYRVRTPTEVGVFLRWLYTDGVQAVSTAPSDSDEANPNGGGDAPTYAPSGSTSGGR